MVRIKDAVSIFQFVNRDTQCAHVHMPFINMIVIGSEHQLIFEILCDKAAIEGGNGVPQCSTENL